MENTLEQYNVTEAAVADQDVEDIYANCTEEEVGELVDGIDKGQVYYLGDRRSFPGNKPIPIQCQWPHGDGDLHKLFFDQRKN